MADLGTVGIAVEVRGREALRQLENDMIVVDRSAKSAARSFEAFERAGLKTAETFRYVSDAAKRRLADEQRITQELVKQRTAAEQLAKANAQKFQSQIGGNLGLGAQGISAGASAGAFEGEIERLRVKYDQVYASSQLYEKSLNELNQAHAFGVLSIKQHEAAVESLNLEYQNFQNGVAQAGNRFAEYTSQSAGRMNQFGVVTQQAGYQIGDFLVQVQSGTNWMVAFGQQATQLVGILPLMGAGFMGLSAGALVALSAGLGIAIPLITAIGAAFMRTSQEADSASKGIDRQTQAYEALTERVRQLRLERQMAASGAQTESEQTVLNTLNAALEERKRLLAEALALEAESTSEYSLREAAVRGELAERQQLNRAAIQQNEELLKALAYQQQLETAAKRRANEERNAYREAKAEADRWKAALEGIKSVLDSINGMAVSVTMDLKSTASGWASEFMGQLTAGLERRAEYAAAVGGGRGLNTGGPELDPFGFRKQLQSSQSRRSSGQAGSGGSGGGAGDSRLTSLLDSLQSEREVIEEWYAESQTILQSASDSELALIGGRNEAKLRLEQEYQEKLKGIRDLGNQTALGQAQTFFGDMASALQGGNDKMLKASRAFAAVEATINAYRAYAQTIADPSLPWWAKIPKALAVLSAGMSVVSAIKGGGSSGGAGGRGSATVSSPTASSPAPQTVFIDSLDPDGLYSGQALINLFDAFYDENDRRGKVFIVQR